jgi:hypothetical protein
MDINKGMFVCCFPVVIVSVTNGHGGNLFHRQTVYSHRTIDSVRVFVFCNKSELSSLFLMKLKFSIGGRKNKVM